MHYIYRYIYLDIYILYIAVNISRITVDKYSGLLTIWGTSASFCTLLPFIFGWLRPEKALHWWSRRHLMFPYFIWLKFEHRRARLQSLFIHALPFWILFFLFQNLRAGARQGCHLRRSERGGILLVDNPLGRRVFLWMHKQNSWDFSVTFIRYHSIKWVPFLSYSSSGPLVSLKAAVWAWAAC